MCAPSRVCLMFLLLAFGLACATGAAAEPAATAPGASAARAGVATPAVQVPAVAVAPPLEQPLAELARALTRLANEKAQGDSLTTSTVDFLVKLATLVGTLVAAGVAIKASNSDSWIGRHRGVVLAGISAGFTVALYYVLAGVVTTVLVIFTAVLFLLTVLVVAGTHLAVFLFATVPQARQAMLALAGPEYGGVPAGESDDESLEALARANVRGIYRWLSDTALRQGLAGEAELHLPGSLAEGYDHSIFQLLPAERVPSHWENLHDRMLVPVGIRLLLRAAAGGDDVEVVNVQAGLVVVREGERLQYRQFSIAGFRELCEF